MFIVSPATYGLSLLTAASYCERVRSTSHQPPDVMSLKESRVSSSALKALELIPKNLPVNSITNRTISDDSSCHLGFQIPESIESDRSSCSVGHGSISKQSSTTSDISKLSASSLETGNLDINPEPNLSRGSGYLNTPKDVNTSFPAQQQIITREPLDSKKNSHKKRSQVGEILKVSKRMRPGTTCTACFHGRKKCDNRRPCGTCIELQIPLCVDREAGKDSNYPLSTKFTGFVQSTLNYLRKLDYDILNRLLQKSMHCVKDDTHPLDIQQLTDIELLELFRKKPRDRASDIVSQIIFDLQGLTKQGSDEKRLSDTNPPPFVDG